VKCCIGLLNLCHVTVFFSDDVHIEKKINGKFYFVQTDILPSTCSGIHRKLGMSLKKICSYLLKVVTNAVLKNKSYATDSAFFGVHV